MAPLAGAAEDRPQDDPRESPASSEPADAEPSPGVAVSHPPASKWLDLNGGVTRWSDSAVRLFGHSADEADGMPFAHLFTSEERAAGKPEIVLARARAQGHGDDSGWRRSRTGRTFWGLSSVTLVRTPDDLEIGYLAITHDLTHLGMHSDAASPPPSVAGLISVGRVAAEAAHELSNLMAAAAGFAEVLERHLPASGVPREACRELVKTCDRGAGVMRKLLGIGRPAEEAMSAVDLCAVVRDVEPLLRQVLPARVVLVTSLPAGLPRVVARVRDVDLALLNLVVNARDAIDGQGSIAICAQLDERGGNAEPRVTLSVRDSGSGMSAAVQRRAFDRFFTTKGHERGTGLGLALVRDAVHACGGDLDLSSDVGAGTCVRVRFRVAERLREAVTVPSDRGAVLGAPRELVMIWAPATTAALLSDLLSRSGYGVLQVQSGDEARGILAEQGSAIAVLLLGGLIAEVEGMAVLEDLGAQQGRPPAIVLGGGDVATPPNPPSTLPGDRRLCGPLAPDRVLAEIDSLLHSKSDQRTASVH